MQLGHTGLVHPQNFPDFLHGKFVEIIKRNHEPFFFGQRVNGRTQNALDLRFMENKKWIYLRSIRNIFHERFAVFVLILRSQLLKASEIQSFDLIYQFIELVERDFHFLKQRFAIRLFNRKSNSSQQR